MNRKGWVVVLLALTVVAVGLTMGLSYAAAAEEPKKTADGLAGSTPAPDATTPDGGRGKVFKKETLMDQLNKGGWIGWIIMALSPVALALIIEHAVAFRREKLCPTDIVNELQDYFNQEQYEEALEVCNVERTFLTDVVRAGLERVDHGYDAMAQAMAATAEELFTNYQLKITWLSLIGTVAPMLGLFGTVSGMIGAFGHIGQKEMVKPAELAVYINEALVTTFQGLAVAIPVMCAYQFIANRIVINVLASGTAVNDLMDRFRSKK